MCKKTILPIQSCSDASHVEIIGYKSSATKDIGITSFSYSVKFSVARPFFVVKYFWVGYRGRPGMLDISFNFWSNAINYDWLLDNEP